MISFTGPLLQTERLTLRVPQAEDFSAFAAFQVSDRAAARGWQMEPAALHDFWQKQFGHWVMRGFGWFVMQRHSDDAPLGYAGLVQPGDAPEPELGWTIWPEAAEGQGYAYEAARAVLGFAFDDLGLASVPAMIARDNTRSAALATRLGATRESEQRDEDGRISDIWRLRRPS